MNDLRAAWLAERGAYETAGMPSSLKAFVSRHIEVTGSATICGGVENVWA